MTINGSLMDINVQKPTSAKRDVIYYPSGKKFSRDIKKERRQQKRKNVMSLSSCDSLSATRPPCP